MYLEGMKDLEVDQTGKTTSVRVTCGCGKVTETEDHSMQKLQLSLRCLDVHFRGKKFR